MQGCHFNYVSIRTIVSRPVFALIHPHTLVVHSTRGIQFVRLRLQQHLPEISQASFQQLQAQEPGNRLATSILPNLRMGHTGATGNEPLCSANTPACRQQWAQAGAQGPAQPQQQTGYQQEPLEPDRASTCGHGLTLDDLNMHASTSGLQHAIPPKPSHSVWSMSASSEGSSADSRNVKQSPSSTSYHLSAHTVESDTSPNFHEQDIGSGDMSYFTLCTKSAHANAEADVLWGVTAEMLTAGFDPEHFIMEHIPRGMLHNHKLTDYAVELIGNGDMSCFENSGRADLRSVIQDPHTVQQSSREQSVLLLIVAVLKPRLLWEHTERSTVIVANLNPVSGAMRLSSPAFLV